MANPFKSALDKAEAHPAIAAMIFGTFILVITLIVMKRNKSTSSTTNTSGVPIDPNTGLPLTNNGAYTLSPTNNDADLLSAISQLQLQIQNLQNPTPAPTPSPPAPTPSPPPNPPTRTIWKIIPWPPVFPIKPIGPEPGPIKGFPINPSPPHAPFPTGGPVAFPILRQVSVVKWSNTNTPWNSTLSGIASHFGESLAYIEKVNPQIKNPNLIYPGQKVNY